MTKTQTKPDDDRLINTEEAASMLGMSKATLETWRCLGRTSLPYIRLTGRAIRYRVGDVREFMRANTVNA